MRQNKIFKDFYFLVEAEAEDQFDAIFLLLTSGTVDADNLHQPVDDGGAFLPLGLLQVMSYILPISGMPPLKTKAELPHRLRIAKSPA